MRILLAILLALVWSAPALAAPNTTHGVACDASVTGVTKGRYRRVKCINVCNNYAAADDGANCLTPITFTDGLPDLIKFSLWEQDGNCSEPDGPVFTVIQSPRSVGGPNYDLDVSPVQITRSTNKVVLVLSELAMDPYLFITVADDTGCTNVDIMMELINYAE